MPKRSRKTSVKQEMHTPVKKPAMKVLSTVSETESSLAESGGFQVGDKVFATVKTCSQPWPAKILQKVITHAMPSSNIPSTPGKKLKEKAKADSIKFLVQFYGTYDSAHVKPEQLLPYTEENSNKFGRPNPSRGANLFQVAMKEIQSCDSYPLARTRRSTRHAPAPTAQKARRQSTPPRSIAPIEEPPQTPNNNTEGEDSFTEAETTLEPESPVQRTRTPIRSSSRTPIRSSSRTPIRSAVRTPTRSSLRRVPLTPDVGLRASQTQTDPVKIQAISEPAEEEEQQQQESAQPLQEPEQEVNMEENKIRTRKRTASASADEPPKKAEKRKGGKKGKKPKGK